MSQLAAQPVSTYGAANCPADDEPGTRQCRSLDPSMDDQSGRPDPPALTNGSGEVLASTYPLLSRQHGDG
jgi:hypothetical protein